MKGYISKREFIQRFWSAYTYEQIQDEDAAEAKKEGASHALAKVQVPPVESMLSANIIEASRKIKSELDVKAKSIQMFRAI